MERNRTGFRWGFALTAAAAALLGAAPAASGAQAVGIVAGKDGGYAVALDNGEVRGELGMPDFPALPQIAAPIVGIAATPSRKGYWLTTSKEGPGGVGEADTDGRVYTHGDATFLGDWHGAKNRPITALAASPEGDVYWQLAADGGVAQSPPQAALHGSRGDKPYDPENRMVGIASSPRGAGYWLANEQGRVWSYGEARRVQDLPDDQTKVFALDPTREIVGVAAPPSGEGVWIAGRDGGVFSFGDVPFCGSLGANPIASDVVGIAARPSGRGYWLLHANGAVDAFGNYAPGTWAGNPRCERPREVPSDREDPDFEPGPGPTPSPTGGGDAVQPDDPFPAEELPEGEPPRFLSPSPSFLVYPTFRRGRVRKIREVSVGGVARGTRVTVLCSGRGCPFARKSVVAKRYRIFRFRGFARQRLGRVKITATATREGYVGAGIRWVIARRYTGAQIVRQRRNGCAAHGQDKLVRCPR